MTMFILMLLAFFLISTPWNVNWHPSLVHRKELLIGFFECSYIVPEYSFLDARGLGAYEGKRLEAVSEVSIMTFIGVKYRQDK